MEGLRDKKKLVLNRWLIADVGTYLEVNPKGVDAIIYYEGKNYSYGFTLDGKWTELYATGTNSFFEEDCKGEADLMTVGSLLMQEARIRGLLNVNTTINTSLPLGVTVENSVIKEIDTYLYDTSLNELHIIYRSGRIDVLFAKGKWATVIKVDEFAELENVRMNGGMIGGMAITKRPQRKPIQSTTSSLEKKSPQKAIGSRKDCFIIGEVTKKTEKYVLINGLKFLRDQVTFLTKKQYKKLRKNARNT